MSPEQFNNWLIHDHEQGQADQRESQIRASLDRLRPMVEMRERQRREDELLTEFCLGLHWGRFWVERVASLQELYLLDIVALGPDGARCFAELHTPEMVRKAITRDNPTRALWLKAEKDAMPWSRHFMIGFVAGAAALWDAVRGRLERE